MVVLACLWGLFRFSRASTEGGGVVDSGPSLHVMVGEVVQAQKSLNIKLFKVKVVPPALTEIWSSKHVVFA